MYISKLILSIPLFLLLSCGVSEKNVPEKLKNENEVETQKIQFDWVKCEECFVEIQKPHDWHFHKEVIPNGFEYYFTPYLYDELGIFKRGLSLVVTTNLKKSTNISPTQQIEQFINNAKKINPNLNVKRSDMQEMQGASFLINDPIATSESLISSIFLIGNDTTDTFYTFVFQYEKKSWDEMQPICKQMLKNLKVSKAF